MITALLTAAVAAGSAGAQEPVLVPSVGTLIAQTTLASVGAVEEGAADPTAATAPETTEAAPAAALTEAPAAAIAAGAAGGLEKARRVAVYELELQGIEKNIGTVVTDSLLAEIRKLRGVAAIGMDEIKDMLSHEANKQILGCEADDACLAEIAGALGVDDLITGKLSKVGDNHVLLVRRIDQRGAKVVGAYNKRLKAGSGQEFLLSVGPAVEELFADRALREGMSRGVPKEVALRLDPPPLPTWTFWTMTGGAAAAGLVGGVFGLLALNAQDRYQDKATGGGTIVGSELVALGNEANGNALAANVTWGVAGGLAITAGIMFLFTDWEGYGDQPAE